MGAAATHSLRAEIMRHLLILACLAFGTGAMADEGDFDFSSLGAKKALRDYKKAITKDEKARGQKQKLLDEDGTKQEKKTRNAFVENLKKALKKSMQSGNLDEANKINAAIKALEQGEGASPAGGSVAGTKGKKKAKKSKARIPRNAVKWNGHHYLLSDIIMSHPEAKQRCEIAGGHLVRIQNARKQEFVARLASKGAQKLYWIDGSDRKREGSWLFSDGTRMKFFYWQPGEPNGKTLGNYITIRNHKSGMWIDGSGQMEESAGWTTGFICEWDE